MIENIETLEQLSQMISDERPVSKDGITKSDIYAHNLKNGNLDKEHHINLCLQAIPEGLTLFPVYPSFLKFIWWMKAAGIFTEEILQSIVDLLKNKWSEEAYSNRIEERSLVILNIASESKHILSFEEIKSISQKINKEDPWLLNRILYEHDPKRSLKDLQYMPTKGFAEKVIVYMPTYLKSFSKEELRTMFENMEIPDKEKQEILKWLEIFAN